MMMPLSGNLRANSLVDQASKSSTVARELGDMLVDALKKTPKRQAFKSRDVSMTCSELLEAARETAVALKHKGLTPGEPVALEIEHSLELAIALYGIFIAGGCAVPIDPDISTARRDAIIADIHPRLRIVRSNIETQGIEVLSQPSDGESETHADPSIAFIVYTSGSSGGPKGVAITHENYVRRMEHIVSAFAGSKEDVDLAWTPSSFIGMLDEFFYPVLVGVPVVIADASLRSDPIAFGALIEREKVSTFRITPSLLNTFLSAGIAKQLKSVRAIYCSGETLSADLQRKVHEVLSADLVGFYGATEAPGVGFHLYSHDEDPLETTICTPQLFATMKVFQSDGAEAAKGDVGEVWIAGCAVADGYWNKPELSAEKFIVRNAERWYRTGDKGRMLVDGRIEILGRIDNSEIKISGVRINLPEICETLRSLDNVRDSWVSSVKPFAGRDPVLVAHCVSEVPEGFTGDSLREKLSARLPAPAVPRFFMRHEQFPLTPNGKLDAQALARDAAAFVKSPPSVGGRAADDSARPIYLREMEMHLVDVWRSVLGNRDIDIDSDFFAYGGTSLLAVKLNAAIEKAFGVRPPLTAIFEAPTVRQLALRMKSEVGEGAAVLLAQTNLDDSAPALFALHGLFVYRDLANGLGQTVHTYGVYLEEEAQRRNGKSRDDVKDAGHLAARYAEQILRIRNRGPFHLAGLSRGGLIALDTAKLLREMGHQVGLVALLDTNAPQTPWRARISEMKKILHVLAGRRSKKFAGEDITDALYRDAHRRLTASPFQGDVAVLRAAISDFGARRDDLGWSSYIDGKICVAEIPGDHLGILKPPNVDVLAKHLNAYIAKLSAQ